MVQVVRTVFAFATSAGQCCVRPIHHAARSASVDQRRLGVNAKGAFWYSAYQGGLNGQHFVKLLKQMMRNRTKPVHLVVDKLAAHKTKLVKDYVALTKGRLTLHFLPGYAPELNPDELVWSHVKRTGVSRTPLRKGEKLSEKIEMQLAAIKKMPSLVRAFFKTPSVAYITD